MLGRSVTFGPKSVEKRLKQRNFFELTTPNDDQITLISTPADLWVTDKDLFKLRSKASKDEYLSGINAKKLVPFLESCDLDSDCDYEPPADVVKKIDEQSDGLFEAKQKIRNEIKEIEDINEELGDKEAKRGDGVEKYLKDSAKVATELGKIPWMIKEATEQPDQIIRQSEKAIEIAHSKGHITGPKRDALLASVRKAAADTKGASGLSTSFRAVSDSIRRGTYNVFSCKHLYLGSSIKKTFWFDEFFQQILHQ